MYFFKAIYWTQNHWSTTVIKQREERSRDKNYDTPKNSLKLYPCVQFEVFLKKALTRHALHSRWRTTAKNEAGC